MRSSTLLHLGFALVFTAVTACGGDPQVETTIGSNENGGSNSGGGGKAGSDDRGEAGTGLIDIGDFGDAGSDPEPDHVCGDGKLELAELCDDGNTENGDGCSSDCLLKDPNYDCSEAGKPCVNQVICGNGRLEGNEVCDVGDEAADGCAADCASVTDGWACPRPGKPCVQLAVCGNGQREKGEGCDDGQATPTDGDGCSVDCQVELGFFCQTPGAACVAVACGDGVRTPGEQCDDGQDPPEDGDGCSAACETEAGFRCGSGGCAPNCGDGVVVSGEECDDGARVGGDGCSAACRVEPFFDCAGAPSVCASNIVCGDGQVDPGERCDPPGVNGCNADCIGFVPEGSNAVCGNGMLEDGEACEAPHVGFGCSAGCSVEAGFTCPFVNTCSALPRCGDGILHSGEACDDGNTNSSDGCSNSCTVNAGWNCTGLQPSLCIQLNCGDGVRTPNEQCDDGNSAGGDGCVSCVVQTGWICPYQDEPCFARCGDGLLRGDEQCDDGNTDSEDGCNAACGLEPGFVCETPNETCVAAECGNGEEEPGEACDDGNDIAGDGCGPTCQAEPTITPAPNPAVDPSPSVDVSCGDGMITSGEECDDGNVADDDGCTSDCTIDPRFTCPKSLELPTSLQMQVTYRDFKAGLTSVVGGHPDFQYGYPTRNTSGIAGTPCTTMNAATCGRLDNAGKPTLADGILITDSAVRDEDTFGLWYRNTNPGAVIGSNGPIQIRPFTRALTLTQVAQGSDSYGFTSTAFFPLDAETTDFGPIGAEAGLCTRNGSSGVNTAHAPPTNSCDINCNTVACQNHNFSFTTELRYFFQYEGGETLSFFGDDDVWVFVNGRLAVDIGGQHAQRHGRVILGDDGVPSGGDSNCSAHGAFTVVNNVEVPTVPPVCTLSDAERNSLTDTRFGLTRGEVYEIVLVHAERQTSASNFRLTLSNFLAERSECTPICGDGIVAPGEVCDDGEDNANDVSGQCNVECTAFAYCGDNDPQQGEACDNGINLDLYAPLDPNGTVDLDGKCAPGCVLPARCGDGVTQGDEQCDRGASNSNSAYGPGSCTRTCTYGGRCGDDQINGNEQCDNGEDNGKYSAAPGSCTLTCQPGPYCGDGVRNGPEQCDDPADPNCIACDVVPFCGDGKTSEGEACDFAQFNQDGVYGGCTAEPEGCQNGPYCGDGTEDSGFEECDLGSELNLGEYDGCSVNCARGPHCGDGIAQPEGDEACDNGFNDDTYAFGADACGAGCSSVPFCGDGQLQSAYELCDDGDDNSDSAYDGCASDCNWGPYCGDGEVDPSETCDEGLENTAYSATGAACGFDCKIAPYCGDSERNGPEQCDDGKEANTGMYGGCKADCRLAPFCGDKKVQADAGEECDDGPSGSNTCTPACRTRSPR